MVLGSLQIMVVLYLLLITPIAIIAGRKIKHLKDFVNAGRKLPLPLVIATTFATWVGSETILGVSTEASANGLLGVVGDPIGAGVCLILFGLFFASKLYSKNHLTIGDYYKERFGKKFGMFSSTVITISYFGWTAAQFIAMSLIFEYVFGFGGTAAKLISIALILFYTVLGGMWSISLSDIIHMSVIIFSVVFLFCIVVGGGDGFSANLGSIPAEKLTLLEDFSIVGILGFLAAFLVFAFGSIPQQDLYQRSMSAKDQKTAVRGPVIGGSIYIIFGLMIAIMGIIAGINHPDLVDAGEQGILFTLVEQNPSTFLKALFFAGLISAIISTASATLLAASAIFTENVVAEIRAVDDKEKLLLTRVFIFFIAFISFLLSVMGDSSIYEFVSGAYSLTLAGVFIPLVFGLYVTRANTLGAMLSFFVGIITYYFMSYIDPINSVLNMSILSSLSSLTAIIDPTLLGLFASFVAMMIGIYLGPKVHKSKN